MQWVRLSHEVMDVALLAEGVDRNQRNPKSPVERTRSPSSRRAWIEMQVSGLSRLQ